jgi:hypothetical protein
MNHDDALSSPWPWRDIDVVVLDAADEGRLGDQFPGVRVVRYIRTRQVERRPTIVVVTGHFFDDGLRHRMAEAKADFFFLRSEFRSAEKLTDVVLNPERYLRGVPNVVDRQEEHVLGITPGSRLEDLVDYVEENDLATTLDPTVSVRVPSARRSLMRHRHDLSRAARITPMNISTGSRPGDNQQDPSIRQLRRLWFWAARVKYPGPDTPS